MWESELIDDNKRFIFQKILQIFCGKSPLVSYTKTLVGVP
ncbi:hypothetical protein X874_4570 [Mannheimia varigena USDA-ARS-USMARC-1312]|nr:hypothetical protein X874_4570 [Mannheimia varigena USDA-ARS-USMARC-1312]AHG80244.1 hypothetical protein X875_16260 [Mannheimia varigena USDA-ARS-USMARC-1388]